MSIFNRIYSRAQWGAVFGLGWGDRSANYPLPECWTHHAVTKHLGPDATVAEEMEQMRVLERIGQQRFGRGISYSFVIFPSGRIYMGLGASRIGAHTGNRNSTSLGVCFAGNYDNNRPTAAAEATYAEMLRDFHRAGILRHPRTAGGHKDAPGHAWNACPGRYLHPRLPAINAAAARAVATPVPAVTTAAAPAAPAVSYADRTSWPERPIVQRINGELWEGNAYNGTKFALVEALRRAGYPPRSVTAWGRLLQLSDWLRRHHDLRGPDTTVEIWKRVQTYLSTVGRYSDRVDGIPGPNTTRGLIGWLNDIRTSYL